MQLRIVAMSDTHLYHPDNVPDGDVLIHAGDIANGGSRSQLQKEFDWLASLPHVIKLYVPGNHDKDVDVSRTYFREYLAARGIRMLVDETVIFNGFSIHGHPWTPLFGKTAAFMRPRDKMAEYVVRIPKCDVLVSHGPPASILDSVHGMPIGCFDLRQRVVRVRPRVHIFGHVHQMHGGNFKDPFTDYYNVAYCRSEPKEPAGDPILVLDLEHIEGKIKVTDLRASN